MSKALPQHRVGSLILAVKRRFREVRAEVRAHWWLRESGTRSLVRTARQNAFEDPERFTAVVPDEVYRLTGSAEETASVHEFPHDGRKHGAGLVTGSHAPAVCGIGWIIRQARWRVRA
ncbi:MULTISPECIES: hypothetical protein [unclassified Streptomyces]|uniref:hypothetical protein n=1 Tax=unclassified Streptomyces TaxID=2593676 RepID=UPI000A1DFC3D|nr:hypothetical protein [Streptomyces sp. 13-12-16]OSP41113.1 hypothetical protein B7767_22710 [Streptomyces sp. 13-12-16]